MRKIRVFCNAGMSTSILVKNMEKYAGEIGYEVDIKAYSVGQVASVGAEADIVLLGPQVAYEEKKVKKQLPDKEVHVINMTDYGTVNGKNVIEFVKKTLGD